MKNFTHLLVLFLLVLIVPISSFACSCDFPKTPEEALSRTKTAFIGRVNKISEKSDGLLLINFAVVQHLKGTRKPEFESNAYNHKNNKCGVIFEIGKTYRIYNEEPISICSGSGRHNKE